MLKASTKGKSGSKRIMYVVFACIIFLLSVIMLTVAAGVRGNDDFKALGIVISAIAFAMGILCLLYGFIATSSYVDVYDDHIEGKALIGKKIALNSFYLKNHQIRSVTVDQGVLCIHTDSGDLKIVCGKKASDKIFRLINQEIQR